MRTDRCRPEHRDRILSAFAEVLAGRERLHGLRALDGVGERFELAEVAAPKG